MYVKVKDGTVERYPYTVADFRQDFPNVSVPKGYPASALEGFGVHEVTPVDPPVFDEATHKVVEAVPVLDGTWKQAWEIVEKTLEEKNAYARQVQLGGRSMLAAERLLNVATVLKDIRTRQDGRAYVAVNASTVPQLGAIVGDLVFVVAQIARLQLRDRDDLFPDEE